MAKRIDTAFATSGDTTVVPDTSSGEELSYNQGWSSAYSRPKTEAGYRFIDRGQHNQLWNDVTGNIKQWQEQIYPDWYSDIAYPARVAVYYSVDDTVYISKSSGSPAGTAPTNETYWQTAESFFRGIESYKKSLTINFSSDSNLTLNNLENEYGELNLTDTGVILTASRIITVSNMERKISILNSTAQVLTIKTAAGSGINIAAQTKTTIRVNSSGNVVLSFARNELGIDQYAKFSHTLATGVPAGTKTSGIEDRPLVSTDKNNIGGVSLNAGTYVVSLVPGKYYISGWSANYLSGNHQCYLTDSSNNILIYGSSESVDSAGGTLVQNKSVFSDYIDVPSGLDIKIRHYSQLTSPNGGFGTPCNSGQNEIYSVLEIWKVG